MKRTSLKFFSFLFVVFLTACGSNGAVACEEQYWNGIIGMCIPAGWSEVTPDQLRERGIPQEVLVVFQFEQLVSGSIPTVLVTRETLTRDVDPKEYSQSNVVSVHSLSAYEEVDVQDIAIDEMDVQLHVFFAQPVPEEPKKRFYQVSSVVGGVGYTVTAAVPVSIESQLERQILTMLKSVTFMEEGGEEQ